MSAGHLAAGLGIATASPGRNAGRYIFLALFPDFLLGRFLLAGWEYPYSLAEFPARHFIRFYFPYSHSLLAVVFWALLVGLCAFAVFGALRAAALGAVCVLSHFLLDAIAVTGLPLGLSASPTVGLGLGMHLNAELITEVAMLVTAIGICLHRRGRASLWHGYGTCSIVAVAAIPSLHAVALGAIAMPSLVAFFAAILDRRC